MWRSTSSQARRWFGLFQAGVENVSNTGTAKKVKEQRTRVRCSRLVPSPGTSPKPLRLRERRNGPVVGAGAEDLGGQRRADYCILIRAEGAGSGLTRAYWVPPDVVARLRCTGCHACGGGEEVAALGSNGQNAVDQAGVGASRNASAGSRATQLQERDSVADRRIAGVGR